MEESQKISKCVCISGTGLKLIAIAAMFIDHAAAIVVDGYLATVMPANQDEWKDFFAGNQIIAFIYLCMILMRLIGRFGFPIFAFLIVEGFMHTRSVAKYACNLGIFALISEIPFDLGFHQLLIDPKNQNVFFTLLFGLLSIAGMDYLHEKQLQEKKWIPLFYPSAFLAGFFGLYMFRKSFIYRSVRNRYFKYLTENKDALEALKKFINAGYEWFHHMVNDVIPGSVTQPKGIAKFLMKLADLGMEMQFTYKLFFFLAFTCGMLAFVLFLIVGMKWNVEKKNAFTFLILPITVGCALGDLVKTDYSACGVFAIILIYLLRHNKVRGFLAAAAELTIYNPMEFTTFFMLVPVWYYSGERGKKINKYLFYAFYPVHLTVLYLLAYLLGWATFSVR